MAAKVRGRGRPGATPAGSGARGAHHHAPPARGRGRGGGGNSVGKFLGAHTGRQAGKIASAEAGREYNPEIRELREQAKGSRQREGQLADWYNQLQADYQGAQDAGAAALQSVQDTASKQLAEAGAASSADQQRLAEQDEAFAKLTGGPKDTTGLSKIAQAGAAAQRARVAIDTPIAQEQANFVGAVGGQKAAAGMRGIEARKEEADRREKLRDQAAAARREKGAATVANKEKLRESDRGYVSEQRKLKLEKREAASAEQQAAADQALARIEAARKAQAEAVGNRQEQERIGISRRNANISAKNARTSARSQRATEHHYKESGGKNGLTPGEENTNKKERQNAAALVHSAVAQAGPPKTKAEAAELERLAVEAGGSPREVHRAIAKIVQREKAKRRSGYRRRLHEGKIRGH